MEAADVFRVSSDSGWLPIPLCWLISDPLVFDPLKSDRIFSIGASDNAEAIIGARLIPRLPPCGLSELRLALRTIDYRN